MVGPAYTLRRPAPQEWDQQPKPTMNKEKIILAATPALIASAALLLSCRFPMNATVLVAYGCVLVLGAFIALEYRINWKRLFGL